MENNNEIKVVELFAGVGGFRVGLEKSSNQFKTIWANQWEPGKSKQHAFDCYVSHFGKSENHVNEDISLVKYLVPDHDLLVGGFPCQDYSVAQSGATGIEGKKGVLWWQIRDIVESKKPSYILLENVDRLIKSPSSQRGRDFGIILRCLNDLGYAVEWRVINAADYGFAQKRRRVFIFAYKETTNLYKKLIEYKNLNDSYNKWILEDGFYSNIFPLKNTNNDKKTIKSYISSKEFDSLTDVSNDFKSPFFNCGVMFQGEIFSEEKEPEFIKPINLMDILEDGVIPQEYFLGDNIQRFEYLKSHKKIERIKPNGDPYFYSEGQMLFPDALDRPARTMLTSESSVNRSTHVVSDKKSGRLRLLTPVECERLNGFPDNWTNTGMPHKFRYFTMGNALVTGIVQKIGNKITDI